MNERAHAHDDTHRPDVPAYEYGPTPGEVADARSRIEDALAERDEDGVPDLPRVRTLRTLQEVEPLPWHVEDATITSFEVTHGDPMHGEMRSDDHVSGLSAIVRQECPECGHQWATFQFNAYHHIAGSYALTCRTCDHEHAAEQWS